MENNWILIHNCEKLYKAEIIRQLLEDHGIRSFLINKQDSMYHFGEIEIYTLPDDVLKARHLIDKFES